ncbi:MAG: efflux RND transporter periplasmic adaptor subunit, partial [Lachnospiraceae bacterium]|nr:efflux RND transporter periplasmic adaptor subunit [Lachnospiraceae bacterium]
KDKQKRLRKILIIVAVILAIIGFIVYKVMDAKKKLEEMMAQNKVQTAQIERRTISKAISTTGTIQSKDVRTLTSPLAGVKIDKVNYKVGDMVNEGAIVVTFSVEDINKKIGQLEEDITEAKQAKALDAGDRNNAYVKGYDGQTYNVATTYEKLQKADKDLQNDKEKLQKACNDVSDFKALHEEAKEHIDEVQEKLLKKQKDLADAQAKPDNYDEVAELTNDIASLNSKITKYRTALDDSYSDNLEKLEEAAKSAQTTVDNSQRNFDLAYVDFNKAGYDAGFNNASSDYNYNKGNLQANDNVKNLERQKEQNEDSLENYIVTAPISGLVTAVNAQEGNGYQATTGALMTIQAVDVYEVTTQVDEYDINNVKIGQDVVIMTDATGDDEIKGKVTFVAPTATSASSTGTATASAATTSSSSTFEVKIDILNKDERLKFGMSAKLNILVDTHENVLAVPYDAIEQKDDGDTYIYVTEAEDKKEDKDSADSEAKEILGITVVGSDGKTMDADDLDDESKSFGAAPPDAKRNAKEIKVKVGLEGDFYTEISSPEIKEGMTVLVDSKAGELQQDMSIFGGEM